MDNLESILCLENSNIKEEVISNFKCNNKVNKYLFNVYFYNKYTYYLLYSLINFSFLYTIVCSQFYKNILYILFGYIVSQLIFINGHSHTHYAFLTFGVDELEPVYFIAYYHHYKNPSHMPENWLYHRLSFFFVVSFLFHYVPLLAINYYYNYSNNLLNSVMFFSSLQELGHDWYHCKNKKEFFNPFYYYLFRFFEYVNILNTEKHKKHHNHTLKNLEDVTDWDDFRIPVINTLAEYMWLFHTKYRFPYTLNLVFWYGITTFTYYCSVYFTEFNFLV